MRQPGLGQGEKRDRERKEGGRAGGHCAGELPPRFLPLPLPARFPNAAPCAEPHLLGSLAAGRVGAAASPAPSRPSSSSFPHRSLSSSSFRALTAETCLPPLAPVIGGEISPTRSRLAAPPHARPPLPARGVRAAVPLFTDGITNKLIGCYVGDITDDVVLVRIYGNKTELLVDRDEEVKSFRVLQAHGCAPQLYCTFNNGLCYEFMQGEALDPEHVCNPDIFRLIARQLAKIHTIHAHNGWIPKSNLWLKMGKYFSLIPTEFMDEEVNKRFLSDIPSSQVLQEEMAWMKERLSNLGSPVVLCHNDLLCKNIIYNKKRGVCGCSVLLKTEGLSASPDEQDGTELRIHHSAVVTTAGTCTSEVLTLLNR
ncbi:ethanolamine kinase 1 isoform X2 [Columba livia]|uniref:ethanolamine kinase 1 isoform X2 n=1 Tax=Columba livia TaxID=8932 RepID=UPI0031BB5005